MKTMQDFAAQQLSKRQMNEVRGGQRFDCYANGQWIGQYEGDSKKEVESYLSSLYENVYCNWPVSAEPPCTFAGRPARSFIPNSMKRILSLFAVILTCSTHAAAQVKLVAISRELQTMASPLPASQCLDSTVCVVLYRHTYPRDDFKGGFRKAEDLMTLQIGRQVSKSFSHDLNLWDRNLTYGENNRIRYRFDMVDYDLFRNHPAGRITVQHRIPYSRMLQGMLQVVEYEEPLPVVAWDISERRDTVCGYPCFYAEGRFAGRKWRVWFAPDLPFPVGPWKLGGLPGLILKAEDSDSDYSFEATRIATEQQPILLYDWHPVRMSKSKWLRTERRMHTRPSDFFTRNGEVEVLDPQTRQPLDDWTIPYNPIERE